MLMMAVRPPAIPRRGASRRRSYRDVSDDHDDVKIYEGGGEVVARTTMTIGAHHHPDDAHLLFLWSVKTMIVPSSFIFFRPPSRCDDCFYYRRSCRVHVECKDHSEKSLPFAREWDVPRAWHGNGEWRDFGEKTVMLWLMLIVDVDCRTVSYLMYPAPK